MNDCTNKDFDIARSLNRLENAPGSVLVVGSLNADLTVAVVDLPKPGQTVTGGEISVFPGGKSSNQACQAALLGARVSMIGAVGDDVYGKTLLSNLEDAGVNIDGVLVKDDVSTGTAVVAIDDKAQNFIIVSPGANAHMTPEIVEHHRSEIEKASVIGLCLESPIESVFAAATIAQEVGTRVVLNYSPIVQNAQGLLALTDVLLVNEVELSELIHGTVITRDTPDSQLQQVSGALQEHGVGAAIVTLGSDGSLILDGETFTRVEPHRVDAIDSTGCGDSFMGSTLAALAAGFTLQEAGRVAGFCSAHAATRYGAQTSYFSAEGLKTLA